MIPSIVSERVERAIRGYLRASFAISNPFFHTMLDDFFERREELFKGPYVTVNLPFKPADIDEEYFENIPLGYKPYAHQLSSWKRLSAGNPQPTIVATGTGSGKTECFLLPILNHCLEQKKLGKDGIKAIFIYPMNALATDQASRLAKLVESTPALKESGIRAGLYVGQRESNPSKVMYPDKIITDREVIRKSPPDILLTNYKMLDYMLVRPVDFELWSDNEPTTLKYLVVDELHTFDGAQGTDLACLVRRLKERLGTPKDNLCTVGTSATVGGDLEGILEFAEEVFGEAFTPDSVIGEVRLHSSEWLGDELVQSFDLGRPDELEALNPSNFATSEEFFKVWLEYRYDLNVDRSELNSIAFRKELGKRLRGDLAFHNLLKVLDGKTKSFSEVCQSMRSCTPVLKNADEDLVALWLSAFLGLVSFALKPEPDPDNRRAILDVRLQLWLRELRRMVCLIEESSTDQAEVRQPAKPQLRFSDDLMAQTSQMTFPVIHCLDCGQGGLGCYVANDGDEKVETNLSDFYRRWFSKSPNVRVLYPVDSTGDFVSQSSQSSSESLELLGQPISTRRLCTKCGTHRPDYSNNLCPNCGHAGYIRVEMPEMKTKGNSRISFNDSCPRCESAKSLSILGAQSATLSSVAIDQLFGTPFNSDKKLMTFSDSVQDAAHRAGFFRARTFNNVFRVSLQQFLGSQPEGISLAEVSKQAPRAWLRELGDVEFVTRYIPPDLYWFRDYYDVKEGKRPSTSIVSDLLKRLEWQVLNEYGFSAQVGRTLTRTASSIATPDPKILPALLNDIQELVKNERPDWGEIPEAQLRRFVLGLFWYLGKSGAYWHEVFSQYVAHGGESGAWGTMRKKNYRWMKGYGPRARHPRFPSEVKSATQDKTLISIINQNPNNPGWIAEWLIKTFSLQGKMTGDLSWILRNLLEILSKHGLLLERDVTPKVWALNPDATIISNSVSLLSCDSCGQKLSVSMAEKDAFLQAPCVLSKCKGAYVDAENPLVWYRNYYNAADQVRIFTAEHTGLLKRDLREQVEIEFKAQSDQRKPWYPNLISCTPTLEMGIDIGDLSSLLLCSVPPAEASYLQRIGRAGRQNGNALCLTVANARPHDQFFYQKPENMFSGQGQTPGIFLRAASVLKRQFFAFALGRWLLDGKEAKQVPEKLGEVLDRVARLGKEIENRKSDLNPKESVGFPVNFITWVDQYHGEAIFSQFRSLFVQGIDDQTEEELRVFLNGDGEEPSFGRRFLLELLKDSKNRQALTESAKKINNRLSTLKKRVKDKNAEEEIEELKQERSALRRLIKSINQKDIWQHLCDLGCLPNYAFPEAGVTLKTLILREKAGDSDDDKDYECLEFSYERGAAAAIHEFAPGNWFHAGGRKVKIDAVEVKPGSQMSFRFCPECPHVEMWSSEKTAGTCPKCGALGFADQGQVRNLLRLESATATITDHKSLIGDESDDRQSEFYIQKLMVEAISAHKDSVYEIPSAENPFGFDFLTKARFRDINFGKAVEIAPEESSVVIAKDSRKKVGFEVCTHPNCGKVQEYKWDPETRSEKLVPTHSKLCDYTKKGKETDLVKCLWLYREFESEAARFLLPTDLGASSEKCAQSFLAVMQLGLKKFYRGKVDHIRATLQSEPDRGSDAVRNYVILYDSVPGGTGYLQKLFEENENGKPVLIDLLQSVREHLESCECTSDPEKDGCYQCVYTYQSANRMEQVSRSLARNMLVSILANKQSIRKIDSVEEIKIIAQEDSELERMFIQAIAEFGATKCNTSLKKSTYKGQPAYRLKVSDDLTWVIRQQINLDIKDGVERSSRADFFFEAIGKSQVKSRGIAVFTDGWAHHKDRLSVDVLQREALKKAGFTVFSIGYKDVYQRKKISGTDWFTRLVKLDGADNSKLELLSKWAEQNYLKSTEFGLKSWRELDVLTSFDLFLSFLEKPSARWNRLSRLLMMLFLDKDQVSKRIGLEAHKKTLGDEWYAVLGQEKVDFTSTLKKQSIELLQVWSNQEFQNLMSPVEDANRLNLHLLLDDRDLGNLEMDWYEWLRLSNLLGFDIRVRTGCATFSPENHNQLINILVPPEAASQRDESPSDWQAILDEMLDEYLPLFEALASKGIPAPTGPDTFMDGNRVVTDVECLWEERQLALVTESNAVSEEVAKHLGINFLVIDKGTNSLDSVLELFGEKV